MTEHTASGRTEDGSIGDLVSRMSEQTSRLIRNELRLAQAEMAAKGKRAGVGAGMFGGAGLLSVFGIGCLVTTAILALAGPVADWLAALIVGIVLFAVAGVVALVGKKQVAQAGPPVPTEAVQGVKQDVQTLKSGSNA
jgi:membrane-associated protease RseP (regulator of RpoE activity)